MPIYILLVTTVIVLTVFAAGILPGVTFLVATMLCCGCLILKKSSHPLPSSLLITSVALTTLWACWSMGEMYHEGWWGSWTHRLPYLIPPALFMVLTLVALTWPRVGGGLTIAAGLAVGWFFRNLWLLGSLPLIAVGGIGL